MTSASHAASRIQRRAWLAWTAISLIWGTTFLAIKIALETIPPFFMGGLRFVLAGAILAFVLRLRGHVLPVKAEWGRVALLGFCMLTLGNGGVVWGEQVLPSGLTSVLTALTPFWMVGVNAMLPDGDRLHARQWIGLTVGFFGIVLLVWPDLSMTGGKAHGTILGVLALQVSSIGWAIGSSYTRRHVMPRDVLGSAALQMLFGGAMMLAASAVVGEWPRVAFSGRTMLAFLYLILVGSVIAFAAYSYALRHLPVAIVSLYTYVNPVIAVTLGTLLLGEPFHVEMVLAAAVIVVGILIVGPAGSAPK